MSVLPRFFQFSRQASHSPSIDLAQAITSEWSRLGLAQQMLGKRIALGFGSRGITGLSKAAKTLVDLVRSGGGEPFIIPAMGSHGGGTDLGQKEMLAGLGISESTMGCPVLSSMDVVDLGSDSAGNPLYCDRLAAQCDGILLFNRIKAHTSFSGEVESGIHKMLTIGLGKEKAATWIHALGSAGLAQKIPQVARALVTRIPFLAGFAVIENASHQPTLVEALTTESLATREPKLLELAKSMAPSLPVTNLDVLIIDSMGKDLSGTGMDTRVIGRLRIVGEPEPLSPRISAIVALRLTEASHGNALGIGLADFTTTQLIQKINYAAMARNVAATGNLERGRVPLAFATDQEAILTALKHVFRRHPDDQSQARIMRLSNTLELDSGWASESLFQELYQQGLCGSHSPMMDMPFSNSGNFENLG